MESKTWKVAAKPAGTQVRGKVTVAARFGQLDEAGLELGDAIVAALTQAAKSYRLKDESQPDSGEVAEELAGYTVMAQFMLAAQQNAETPDSSRSFARLLEACCRHALVLEPRFVTAYGLARTIREQVENFDYAMVDQLCGILETCLPEIVRFPGQAERALLAEFRDPEFGEPEGGTAEMDMQIRYTELEGADVDAAVLSPPEGSLLTPLPLFQPGQPEPRLFVQMVTDKVELFIDLEAKRPVYGALRAMLTAVEVLVEKYQNYPAWDVVQAIASAKAVLRLVDSEAFEANDDLPAAVYDALAESADVLCVLEGTPFDYFADLVAEAGNEIEDGASLEDVAPILAAASRWLPHDVRDLVPPGADIHPDEWPEVMRALEAQGPGRIVVAFYEPEDNPLAKELPTDYPPSLEDFKVMDIDHLSSDLFGNPTTQVFYGPF